MSQCKVKRKKANPRVVSCSFCSRLLPSWSSGVRLKRFALLQMQNISCCWENISSSVNRFFATGNLNWVVFCVLWSTVEICFARVLSKVAWSAVKWGQIHAHKELHVKFNLAHFKLLTAPSRSQFVAFHRWFYEICVENVRLLALLLKWSWSYLEGAEYRVGSDP